MSKPVIAMYDYHVWANQTLINRLKEVPRELYTQEMKSVFPTIATTLAHIHLVDIVWLEILKGMDMKESMTASFPLMEQLDAKSLEEMETSYQEVAEKYRAFIRTLDDLDHTIVLDNPYTTVRDTSYAEILLQIVTHANYHRGNISAMLRQAGYASTMTDYALYWYAKE
ncbi:DinB family protein [Brevibacillus nitrificans]|uniref:DinB family protein n=1 Tax=Brevibacillus nitrificans TaxID=651560 RepID=UPI0028623F34|nr:DinB family protein [Brevibacillus nitrificans]MDR7314664.1 putative damage-inducible protein DinB [Brevibacillus nitrificans]